MPPLDTLAKRFLMVCGLLFVTATALKLNGSSIHIWKEVIHDRGDFGGLVLSTPKDVRSDEWEVWTPAVLWQAKHGFPTENSSLGPGKTALIYNLPARHYSMLFKPQLYGFFLFDIEHGYSWYWSVKVFGLLGSIFLLLLLLTRDSKASLFGTFWVFLSNYIQWWFSCPPMLPEMLSAWAVALVAAFMVVTSRSLWMKLVFASVFVAATASFILCLYPAFQIPLFYLGLFLFAGLIYRNRQESSHGVSLWPGLACLCIAVLVAVAALWPFFQECRPTFEMLSNTTYPGHRRTHGGTLHLVQLFSGLMNFFNSETAYPDQWGQVNAAANFYPLWIAVLLFTGRGIFTKMRKHPLELATLACIFVFSIYAVTRLPDWFCKYTLLSLCTEERSLLVIGIANILFCTLGLRSLKASLPELSRNYILAALGVLSVLVWFYLWQAAPKSPRFLQVWRIGFFFLINVTVFVCLVKTANRVFCGLLIGLLAAGNLLVNPVMIGLEPLLKATPRAAIEELIRAEPHGIWAVYDNNLNSEFVMAMGADILSGVKIVPDLDFYKQIDPEGNDMAIYNRYGFAYFLMPPKKDLVLIRYIGFPTHVIAIHPTHPVFRARNVRYFVFGRSFAEPAKEGLKLVLALPQNGMWVYELAASPG